MVSLILTTDERIRAVEAIIDYEFVDKTHLEKALAAAGATKDPEGNKPGAALGDAQLKIVIIMDGLRSGHSIGHMAKRRDTLATNPKLTQIGDQLGLKPYIRPNPAQGFVPDSLVATTVQAIIGAVFLDSNKDFRRTSLLIVHMGILEQ
ncbi:unnamed protein product [Penicillium salamii]|uniref:RNase III domain-containing protein n=1 Tax=Penicillium salamii TaxID=1612424 RepID=A0A9W4ITX0_9EURO|nr:unnamed protein product [Penicillium salamii]CAG8292581.1 unnamed protein product [Penicillium salamii]CAG8344368.1 unnamed protein product [Penicillium salamii]CAG8346249.1 unnamed protein product [Penicillium salamii]CAG8351880.1 unnamed protein product [Penicillium salamii]